MSTQEVTWLVRDLRKSLGLTQHQVAKKAGISLSQYGKWECHATRSPSQKHDESIRAVAIALMDEAKTLIK